MYVLFNIIVVSPQTEFNYQLTNVRCNSINPYFVKTKLMEDLKPEQLYLKEHYQLIMDGSEKLDADDQYIRYSEYVLFSICLNLGLRNFL